MRKNILLIILGCIGTSVLLISCKKGSSSNSNLDNLENSGENPSPNLENKDYAYISSRNLASIYSCSINKETGEIKNDCKETLNVDSPDASFIKDNHFYQVNINSSSVSKCAIIPETGVLQNCAVTAQNVYAQDGADGIDIKNNYAYVTHFYQGEVKKCSVNNNTGEISECGLPVSVGGKAFRVVSNDKYAYISNYNGYISKCEINSVNGDLSSCATALSGLNSPVGLFVANSKNTSKVSMYIAEEKAHKVKICDVETSNGNLTNCKDSGVTISRPYDIKIFLNKAYVSTRNKQYVGSTQDAGAITVCDIHDQDGTLSNCKKTLEGFEPILNGIDGLNFASF